MKFTLQNLLSLCYLLLSTSILSSQWGGTVNPWTAQDPVIQGGAPRLIFNNNAVDGISFGSIYRFDGSDHAHALYQPKVGRFFIDALVGDLCLSANEDVIITNDAVTSMVIKKDGKVGIGVPIPEAQLHISDGIPPGYTSINSNVDVFIEDDDLTYLELSGGQIAGVSFFDDGQSVRAGTFFDYSTDNLTFATGNVLSRMVITENGNVGIGTTTPSADLQVNGDVLISGELTTASDRRLKHSIIPIDNALDLVRRLQPRSYQYDSESYPELKLSADPTYGLIAQEVEEVAPLLVKEGAIQISDKENTLHLKSINYTAIIPLLIGAVQDQQILIEELKAEIKSMKSSQK